MNKMTSTASVVAAVLAVTLGVSRAATGADHDPVQAQLDRDVRANTALGVTGVQAQLATDGQTLVATSGVADRDVTLLVDADASGGLISTTADLNTFFRALLGGRLLNPAELAQMKRTYPVDDEIAMVWPGARYGLGIFEVPLPCGGSYWMHNGGQEGFVIDNGVTTDGRHSIAVSMTTALALGTPPHDSPGLEQAHAANTLVQNALCEVAR